MKKIISLAALLLTIFIMAGCVNKTEVKRPIKIGINVWSGYADAFIAQEKGFFKRNNVNVQLVFRREQSETQRLYIDEEVDGVFEVFADTLFHGQEGVPTKTVYITDYSDTGDVIMGRPEFNSLADLKGKKVGIEQINGFSHFFVLKSLEKAGVPEVDMQFEHVPAHEVLKALDEGRIDAGHTWEPTKSAALKEGYKILATAGEIPGIIIDVLSFNSEIIEKRPGDIQAIIKSIIEARDFVDSNKEEALEIMAKSEGMTKEEMERGLKGIYQPDMEGVINAMKESNGSTSLYHSGKLIAEFYLNRGQLTGTPAFSEIIEPKFVNNLAKKAGK